MNGSFERLFGRVAAALVGACSAWPRLVIALCALSSAGSLWIAASILEVDTDSDRLLSPTLQHPDRCTLVEAKSAQTASSSLFEGANRVRRHLDDPSRPCEVVVAYGGDESQRRTDGRLLSWSQLQEEAWD